MSCPKCGAKIKRVEEKPGPGESRRVSWSWCVHMIPHGAVGMSVEWMPPTRTKAINEGYRQVYGGLK